MEANTARSLHLPDPALPDLTVSIFLSDAASLPVALARLKGALALPINGTQAIALLRQFASGRPMYRLYRTYFPRQWARSTASLIRTCESECSPREAEFLHLVDAHLFPLDIDYLLDRSDDGINAERIELLPYAPRWWEEEGEFAPGWVILLLLSGLLFSNEALRRLEDVEELTPHMRQAVAAEIQARPAYSLDHLRALCAQIPPPLAALPIGLSMMLYATGNEWLDVHGDDGSLPFDRIPLCWCEQHIDLLTSTFRQAQALERQVQALVDWLETDLEAQLWPLLTLLKQARPTSSLHLS